MVAAGGDVLTKEVVAGWFVCKQPTWGLWWVRFEKNSVVH